VLRTPLCARLGIEVPIFSAPMGPDISGPELVAAVSQAGGCGVLQAQLHPPDLFREQVRKVKALTSRPFGVNFILQFPSEDSVRICLEEGVPLISFFWGDPAAFVKPVHAAGAKVIQQVGSVDDARRAVDAGVDILIAQGVEAGGHIAGEVTTMALVPCVVDVAGKTPVVAAGGITDARGLVAALALGAQGVSMGTRFLASQEANVHPHYQKRLLAATEKDTVRTTLFGHGWPNAPHRTLRTAFVEEWLRDEARGSAQRPDEPRIGQTRVAGQTIPLHRFMGFPPNRDASGDIDSMDLLMGQGAGLVNDIRPAGEIVRGVTAEAEQIIRERLAGMVSAQ